MPRSLLSAVALVLLLGLAACASGPTATPTAQPSDTPAPTSTTAATATAVKTATSLPTPTAAKTATAVPAPTAVKTATPTAEPTPSATPTLSPAAISFPDGLPELGDTLTRPIDGMVMVYVPGGAFQMGSLPDDDWFGPHSVTLDGFWIDQIEVTNAPGRGLFE